MTSWLYLSIIFLFNGPTNGWNVGTIEVLECSDIKLCLQMLTSLIGFTAAESLVGCGLGCSVCTSLAILSEINSDLYPRCNRA